MKILILAAFLCMAVSSRSQTFIKGSISDEVTGEKLGKVTVKIIDHHIGVLTDSTGYFILTELPDRILTLEFSFIGYMPYLTTVDCDALIEPMRIRMTPAKIYVE